MCPMRAQRSILAGIAAMVIAAGFGGCGKGAKAAADGGAGGARSFDVVAVLGADVPDASVTLPPMNTFTLVLDALPGLAIAGGNGLGAVIAATTADERRFVSNERFSVQGDSVDVCNGPAVVRYDDFDVTISGAGLTGTADGYANVVSGDSRVQVPFTAMLTGTRDKTPPTLRASGSPPATPLAPFTLLASEPLPFLATAQLVADDGATIELVPVAADGGIQLIVGFTKPDVVLRAGRSYAIALDGLVDFAGLDDRGRPPLPLASFAEAPTVPTDGFESASGATLGGAMVVKTASGLPVIDGDTSLYVGGPGAPFLDAPDGRGLLVTLARQAGETTLHFSCTVIAEQAQALFAGSVQMGSEGASPGPILQPFVRTPTTQMATVAGRTVYLSATVQVDLGLPFDATDTVLFSIRPDPSCPSAGSASAGMLIDDLRLQ